LRSLPTDLADLVASHLVAAARAMSDDEPERAYEHAKVARRFAGRIGIIREATGIAAYRAGQYAEALADLRAARRMTGADAYLPVMADCERGLGRPERALDLVRSKEAERLDREGKIELAIVESGARRDMGQFDAAVVTLQRLTELRDPQRRAWSVRLAYAYADALAAAGHETAATDWFERAMTFDEDGETDAAERYAELTGAVIEDLEEDFDEGDDENDDEGGDDLTGDLGDDAAADAVGDLAVKPRGVETDSADAEADDLDDDLDDDVEDDEDDAELSEARLVGDILDDLPQERGSSRASRAVDETPIATAPQGPETKADEAEPGSAQGEDGVADLPAEAAKPASEEAEKATAVDTDEVSAEPVGAVTEPKNEASAFGPAFIEPDFGDVIEDAEDDEDAEDADGGVKRQP
jgi:tetratricopeptide (TPR) repeat protein